MKLSRHFLDDYVNTHDISNKDLAEAMTNVGNEYDEIRDIATGTNLVVGEVLTCKMHPNSDHLHVCTVDVGNEVKQIVCGAPNVKENIKVIVALVGAVLPGGVIKKGVIRGEESDGMLCSLAEIGLDSKYYKEEDAKGIAILPNDAPVGEDAKKYLGYDDTTIDFELTANRSDLLSVLGMAYEVGAILDEKVTVPCCDIESSKNDINDYLTLDVETENAPLYLAKMVKNVTIKESPLFIKTRLMASGIRPINNVVDISNFVMMEYGQPLHFFNYKTLGKKIIVRMANDGEKITTLDKEERILSKDDIVIANPEGPVCLAGVMGGLNSEIENDTVDVVIESAIFNPVNIRKTARKILTSEASSRFEHGLDYNRTYMAINRACYLLSKYADATIVSGTLEHNTITKKENVITITKEKIEKVLGFNLEKKEIRDVFDKLGFITEVQDNTFIVSVPSRRLDISIAEDLIEEVGRIYGISKVVGRLPKEVLKPGKRQKEYEIEKNIKEKLVGLGLKEAITYSLVDDNMINMFKLEEFKPYEVLRPISNDKKYMRSSIVPSLLNVYNYNLSHNNKDVNIFEISEIYVNENDSLKQETKLAILMSGAYISSSWNTKEEDASFYLLKGIEEELLEYLGYKERCSYFSDNLPNELHPYQSAILKIDNKDVGYIGKISPTISKKDIFVLELNITKLLKIKISKIKGKEVSKYPSIKKDVAFILDKDIKSNDVIKVIKKSGTNLLKNIEVFDVYIGENIASDKKSVAYSFTFSSNERTLSDQEVNEIFKNIINDVCIKFNSEIRDK